MRRGWIQKSLNFSVLKTLFIVVYFLSVIPEGWSNFGGAVGGIGGAVGGSVGGAGSSTGGGNSGGGPAGGNDGGWGGGGPGGGGAGDSGGGNSGGGPAGGNDGGWGGGGPGGGGAGDSGGGNSGGGNSGGGPAGGNDGGWGGGGPGGGGAGDSGGGNSGGGPAGGNDGGWGGGGPGGGGAGDAGGGGNSGGGPAGGNDGGWGGGGPGGGGAGDAGGGNSGGGPAGGNDGSWGGGGPGGGGAGDAGGDGGTVDGGGGGPGGDRGSDSSSSNTDSDCKGKKSCLGIGYGLFKKGAYRAAQIPLSKGCELGSDTACYWLEKAKMMLGKESTAGEKRDVASTASAGQNVEDAPSSSVEQSNDAPVKKVLGSDGDAIDTLRLYVSATSSLVNKTCGDKKSCQVFKKYADYLIRNLKLAMVMETQDASLGKDGAIITQIPRGNEVELTGNKQLDAIRKAIAVLERVNGAVEHRARTLLASSIMFSSAGVYAYREAKEDELLEVSNVSVKGSGDPLNWLNIFISEAQASSPPTIPGVSEKSFSELKEYLQTALENAIMRGALFGTFSSQAMEESNKQMKVHKELSRQIEEYRKLLKLMEKHFLVSHNTHGDSLSQALGGVSKARNCQTAKGLDPQCKCLKNQSCLEVKMPKMSKLGDELEDLINQSYRGEHVVMSKKTAQRHLASLKKESEKRNEEINRIRKKKGKKPISLSGLAKDIGKKVRESFMSGFAKLTPKQKQSLAEKMPAAGSAGGGQKKKSIANISKILPRPKGNNNAKVDDSAEMARVMKRLMAQEGSVPRKSTITKHQVGDINVIIEDRQESIFEVVTKRYRMEKGVGN